MEQQTIPKGYKQTQLGLIPEDWDLIQLGDVMKIRHGKSQRQVEINDGVYPIWATGGEIGRTNTPIYNKPSVLIGRKGTIDKPRYSETPFWTVDTLFYSEIDLNTNPKFLFYKCCMIDWMSYNEASGVPSLNSSTIESISAVMPKLKEEQTAIAAALSDVDSLITSLDTLIAKKQAIKTATMQQLITGKTRLSAFSHHPDGQLKGTKQSELGEIPEDWDVVLLEDLCASFKTGKLDANAMKPDGEYRFYTCARQHYWIDYYAFDTEALLVSGNGANVGYVHYFKGKFNAYQRTYVLSDFTADIGYIKIYLEKNLSERIRVEVNAGNTPYITMDTLTEMRLSLPSNKEEQTAISTILSDIDIEIQNLQQRLSKTKQIKQGMMQELLTGKTRLM